MLRRVSSETLKSRIKKDSPDGTYKAVIPGFGRCEELLHPETVPSVDWIELKR
jgi:hypothetical protein